MLLVLVGAAYRGNVAGKNITIGLLFCALQPIVSTSMAMAESDVRRYIFDLVTLSCIRKSEETTTTTATFTTTATTITQEKKSFAVLGTKEETSAETLAAKVSGSPTTTPETKEN